MGGGTDLEKVGKGKENKGNAVGTWTIGDRADQSATSRINME